MQEIAFPSSISQQYRGTCTVTTAQILLARTHPAEYARIVAGLAAPGTEAVTMAGGGQWQREPGTETYDSSDRTASSRLFQAAAMEAMYPDGDYDNQLDKNRFADGHLGGGGGPSALAGVVRDLFGPTAFVAARYMYESGGAGPFTDAIIEAATQGHPTLVALYKAASAEAKDSGAGHNILVIEATAEGVRFINPWGQVETVSKADLAGMVMGAVFVNPDGPAAPAALVASIPQASGSSQVIGPPDQP
jgi:hypothetical protein